MKFQIILWVLILAEALGVFIALLTPFERSGEVVYLDTPTFLFLADLAYWVEWAVIIISAITVGIGVQLFNRLKIEKFKLKNLLQRDSKERELANISLLTSLVALMAVVKLSFIALKTRLFPNAIILLDSLSVMFYSDYYSFTIALTVLVLIQIFLLLSLILMKLKSLMQVADLEKRKPQTFGKGLPDMPEELAHTSEVEYLTMRERKERKIQQIREEQERKIKEKQDKLLVSHKKRVRQKQMSKAERKQEKEKAKKLKVLAKIEKKEIAKELGEDEEKDDDDQEIVRDEFDFT